MAAATTKVFILFSIGLFLQVAQKNLSRHADQADFQMRVSEKMQSRTKKGRKYAFSLETIISAERLNH
jgi:hypothetical protein